MKKNNKENYKTISTWFAYISSMGVLIILLSFWFFNMNVGLKLLGSGLWMFFIGYTNSEYWGKKE